MLTDVKTTWSRPTRVTRVRGLERRLMRWSVRYHMVAPGPNIAVHVHATLVSIYLWTTGHCQKNNKMFGGESERRGCSIRTSTVACHSYCSPGIMASGSTLLDNVLRQNVAGPEENLREEVS
jgi:hypothetical protein